MAAFEGEEADHAAAASEDLGIALSIEAAVLVPIDHRYAHAGWERLFVVFLIAQPAHI